MLFQDMFFVQDTVLCRSEDFKSSERFLGLYPVCRCRFYENLRGIFSAMVMRLRHRDSIVDVYSLFP